MYKSDVFERMGQLLKALEMLDVALSFGVEDEMLYYNRGALLMRLQRPEEAFALIPVLRAPRKNKVSLGKSKLSLLFSILLPISYTNL